MNNEQILQLEPSPEADRAFAERLMGWDYKVMRVGKCNCDYYGDGRFVVDEWQPTTGNDGKGDPACWFLGVERLREMGLMVSVQVTTEGVAVTVERSDKPERRTAWCEVATAEHPNSGIAVLRAGVQALEAIGR